MENILEEPIKNKRGRPKIDPELKKSQKYQDRKEYFKKKYEEKKDILKQKYEENRDEYLHKNKILQEKYRQAYKLLRELIEDDDIPPLYREKMQKIIFV